MLTSMPRVNGDGSKGGDTMNPIHMSFNQIYSVIEALVAYRDRVVPEDQEILIEEINELLEKLHAELDARR